MSPRVVLPQISATAWEHPSEKEGLAAVRRRHREREHGAASDDKLRHLLLGDAVRVGPRQRPHLHALFEELLATLDWPGAGHATPELYVSARPWRATGAFGSVRPFAIVSARHIDRLEREEQRFLLGRLVAQLVAARGHAGGHAGGLHMLDCGESLNVFRLFGRDRAKWSTNSELTDDRGALLATQDIDAALMALLRLAGGSAPNDSLSVDAWLEQIGAEESAAASRHGVDGDTGQVIGSHAGRYARRAIELRNWAHSADYSLILSGAYVRRGEEPEDVRSADPASGDAGAGARAAWMSGDDMRKEARQAVNAVGEVIEKTADAVGSAVSNVTEALEGALSHSSEGLSDVVNRAADAFKEAFRAASAAAKAAEEQPTAQPAEPPSAPPPADDTGGTAV